MGEKLRDLQAMSDDELEQRYDRAAANLGSTGVDFWRSELDRRAARRAAEASGRAESASLKLARRSYWLSVISAATLSRRSSWRL